MLVVLGIAAISMVIYMALSKKSTFMVRIVAIGALALMIITVIVCAILSFKATAVTKQIILPDALPSEIPPPEKAASPVMIIFFILFLVGLFVTVLIFSLREQKRAEGKLEPPVQNW